MADEPRGPTEDTDGEPCPDCDAAAGDFHRLGCDIEQCPYCGRQLISCLCRRKPPLDDRMRWSGIWPGVVECREFGWYARRAPGKGWESCRKEDEGAMEDLNRLHTEARWNRKAKRFVR